jgi:hypothetical protein
MPLFELSDHIPSMTPGLPARATESALRALASTTERAPRSLRPETTKVLLEGVQIAGCEGSGRRRLWNRGDFPLGFGVGAARLDADEQFLVEYGEDALEHRDGGDVVAALELGDEGV